VLYQYIGVEFARAILTRNSLVNWSQQLILVFGLRCYQEEVRTAAIRRLTLKFYKLSKAFRRLTPVRIQFLSNNQPVAWLIILISPLNCWGEEGSSANENFLTNFTVGFEATFQKWSLARRTLFQFNFKVFLVIVNLIWLFQLAFKWP